MLESLMFRSKTRRKAGKIYGAVVTQSRSPEFYAGLGVPDTPVGRYEMLVLHLILVLERLREQGVADSRLDRLLVEMFIADIDDSLRELATGDLSVPKKVRRAATGLYDRLMDYRDATTTDADAAALAASFARHVYDVEGNADAVAEINAHAAVLARYARAGQQALAKVDVAAGEVIFPPVAEFIGEAGAHTSGAGATD
ncbi:ubiquinol-cytochrome C chaperone family protein [Hyphomicrobium sulfonivorans]|nr:ubiquinol-cytochrome C chaperone family protein [Hyphomicrobium sulfonivorans]